MTPENPAIQSAFQSFAPKAVTEKVGEKKTTEISFTKISQKSATGSFAAKADIENGKITRTFAEKVEIMKSKSTKSAAAKPTSKSKNQVCNAFF